MAKKPIASHIQAQKRNLVMMESRTLRAIKNSGVNVTANVAANGIDRSEKPKLKTVTRKAIGPKIAFASSSSPNTKWKRSKKNMTVIRG